MTAAATTEPPVFTIGHSTRSAEAFLQLLTEHGVQQIVDVRRFPGSRRYPHFSRDQMPDWLRPAGIEYIHEAALGGRRTGQPDSPNIFWENASFRAYADYMATPEFESALDRLIEHARRKPTAIMCSEAVPWRCHRRLIADALTVRGFPVLNIFEHRIEPHALNPHVRQTPAGQLVYDVLTA